MLLRKEGKKRRGRKKEEARRNVIRKNQKTVQIDPILSTAIGEVFNFHRRTKNVEKRKK